MRPPIRLKPLALVTLAIVVLSVLPAAGRTTHAAQPPSPEDCPPTLAYNTCLGLMPRAYGLDLHAPQLRAAGPGIPFLGAPINGAVGSWAQVQAAADFAGDGRARAAIGTERYFDPVNDRQMHVFALEGGRLSRVPSSCPPVRRPRRP